MKKIGNIERIIRDTMSKCWKNVSIDLLDAGLPQTFNL